MEPILFADWTSKVDRRSCWRYNIRNGLLDLFNKDDVYGSKEEVMRLQMNVSEVKRLAQWLEQKGLKDTHIVTLEVDQTPIGTAYTAMVKMTEDEGLFLDLTDYANW